MSCCCVKNPQDLAYDKCYRHAPECLMVLSQFISETFFALEIALDKDLQDKFSQVKKMLHYPFVRTLFNWCLWVTNFLVCYNI